jgi:hypothetical protein
MTKITISYEQRGNYDPNTHYLRCWLWLQREFGPQGPRWRWDNVRTFEFADSQDALLFAMVWA